MILPTKGIAPDAALLTLAGKILHRLGESKTVSRLWDETRASHRLQPTAIPFDWFVLALDLLFIVGAVEFQKGRVVKVTQTPAPNAPPTAAEPERTE